MYTYEPLAALPYSFPTAPRLLVDSTSVYFTDAVDGVVGAIPKNGLPDGGAPRVIATGVLGPGGIIGDDTNLYWVDTGQNVAEAGVAEAGSILTCPKSGCGASGPRLLVEALYNPSGYLAVDATYLYFTVSGSSQPPHNGLVMRVPK